jgi:hypothetical protein
VAYLLATFQYRKRLAAREAQLRALVAEVLAVTGRARIAVDAAPAGARIADGEDAEGEGTASDEEPGARAGHW